MKRETRLKRWSISKMKQELDKVFSLYIRQLDANDEGYVSCITCKKVIHWQESDASHYISRQHLSTRWDEMNVWPCCRACNRFHGGQLDEFALFLTQQFGSDVLEQLNKKKHTPVKITKEDYLDLIEKYENDLIKVQKTTDTFL